MSKLSLRKIERSDNAAVARVIRTVMPEFGAVGPGFSIEDPEVDAMFESYRHDRAAFYVLTKAGKVVGCGGVAPLESGDADTCELKKMYFLEEARGYGAGKVLGELLIQEAQALGFRRIYIETLERMEAANELYRKLGFHRIESSLGNTGHCGCDTYYLLDLPEAPEVSFGD